MMNRKYLKEILDYKNIIIAFRYKFAMRSLASQCIPSSKLAIVIHLYYEDNWPLFEKRIRNISSNFDLFVSIPISMPGFQDIVKASFPEAYCILVPNKGRDVLPFVRTAQLLSGLGYEYVLKFHSKKSTHWEGGQDWLDGMMERLLSDEPELTNQAIRIIEKKDTGIIGPSDVYYPLTVNFPANGNHLSRVLKGLYGEKVAHQVLQIERRNYGFFGGTMFWVRLDAIAPLLNGSVYDFESEQGQIDGTYAHALERLFSLLPQIEKRNIYELTTTKIRQRDYLSKNIPSWSEDHDK